MPCKICTNPKAAEVILRLKESRLTLQNAAKDLDVSPQMLRYHLNVHEVVDINKLDQEIDTLGVLNEITMSLKKRFDALKELKPGLIMNERMITMLTRELRDTIMDLEKLSGRLQSAPLIQLQQINVHYENMLSFIMTDLCPNCRHKIVSFLEANQ